MKNGFTLIELLAVIVVLAIIALIAVPVVLNIINDAKESSLLRSAEFYLDAVEYTIADAFLYHGGLSNGEYPITPDGNICKKSLPCDDSNTLKVEVSGDKPTGGSITINGGTISDVELYLSNKVIVKNEDNEIVYLNPKSFSEDSWETIAANLRAGNLSKYNVGDTKEITLTGFTNGEEGSNGKYTVRIANTSTPSECNNPDFSQTACGFVVEFEDIITAEYAMNSADTNVGGWESSEMRSYVNNDILNSFPTELKELIIETKVVSSHGSDDSSNFVTTDKLYLLATREVWENGDGGNEIGNDTARELTRQLDYYKNLGVTTDNHEGAKKDNSIWWLRSANGDTNSYFYIVNGHGAWRNSYAYHYFGVSVAFRL